MHAGNPSHMQMRVTNIGIVWVPMVGENLGGVDVFAFGEAIAVLSRSGLGLSRIVRVRAHREYLGNGNEQGCS